MEEDFGLAVRCDHLYRNTVISGDILYSYLNSDNSIIKLYSVRDDYKIYGKIYIKTLKALYRNLKNILNRNYENILNSDPEYVNVDNFIKSLDLPYFQIPIGFDAVFNIYNVSNYKINLKIQSQILFDLFEELKTINNIDKIDILSEFVFNNISVFPYNYTINCLTDETVNTIIPMTLSVGNKGAFTKEITLNNVTSTNQDVTCLILPGSLLLTDTTGIQFPFKLKLLGLDNRSNLSYNFFEKIIYTGENSTNSIIRYHISMDNTNYQLDTTININKSQSVGMLVLNNEYSNTGTKVFSDVPYKSIYKIKNLHKNKACRIIDKVVECYLISDYDSIKVDPKYYKYIFNQQPEYIYDEFVDSFTFLLDKEITNVYDCDNKKLLISFYFVYENTVGERLNTNKVNLIYSGVYTPFFYTDIDKIKYVPKDRIYEVNVNTKISGATIKSVRIEDLGGNPEKCIFGKNIFVMKEHFPIISDSNGSFSIFMNFNKTGEYRVRIYFEMDGFLGSLLYKDFKFNVIDFDADYLAFSNSFNVDNNVYHLALTYMSNKEALIKIRNVSNISLTINSIQTFIPSSSKDIYGVNNVDMEIIFSNISPNSILPPGEEIVLLCNFKSKDFGYNLLFIVVDVDILGKYYFPISTFTNNNILRNVYVISYDNKVDEFVSIKGSSTIRKIAFKNYGDDACLIRNQTLGYEKFNTIISEYSLISPNSISYVPYVYKPRIEGKRYGYIYTELIHQIEAFKIFQSDYTTEYKIHHPGIIHSFISNVAINEGTLVRIYEEDIMLIKANLSRNKFVIILKNVGINPVKITSVIESDNKYVKQISFDKSLVNLNESVNITVELNDNFNHTSETNILVNYIDLNTYKNKATNIKIKGESFASSSDIIINKDIVDFGFINITQIKENNVKIFNNTNKNINIEFDFTGDSEIKIPNGLNIILRPNRVFTIPIGLYCNKLGEKNGILKIKYRYQDSSTQNTKTVIIKGKCIDTNYINII